MFGALGSTSGHNFYISMQYGTWIETGVHKQWTGLLDWITGLTFDLKFYQRGGEGIRMCTYYIGRREHG